MTLEFDLVSEFTNIHRRPFELVDNSILKATNANPLLIGEWLEMAAGFRMQRGSANPAVVPSYPVFSETGRFETQAIGKVPILYMNAFEADTLVFDASSLILGSLLEVADVTVNSLTKRGLQLATSGVVVGHVTRLPAENRNRLRFIRTLT